MANRVEHLGWISRMRLRAVIRALGVTVVFALPVVATPLAQAQHFKVLHTFTGSPDGGAPFGALLYHSGALYGTTADGGVGSQAFGTVFKLTLGQGDTEAVLYTFGVEGLDPQGGVVMDSSGNLYGATIYGGSGNAGIVYKLDTTGKLAVLHNFTGAPDGQYPMGNLVRDTAGNLYGTTQGGGDVSCLGYPAGCGTVFKVYADGSETILHSFENGKDGAVPGWGGLVRGASVNLFGVTTFGGADKKGDFISEGTVFKVDENGEKVIYTFDTVDYSYDGCNPLSGLLRIAGNVFYGTTSACGISGWGTVFKLAQGKETVLYDFDNRADGGYPEGGLATDGTYLYGTTYQGGDLTCNAPSGCGTVFKLNLTTREETVLHSFTGGKDGANPVGPLTIRKNDLYGTTIGGGASNQGVVFRVTTR